MGQQWASVRGSPENVDGPCAPRVIRNRVDETVRLRERRPTRHGIATMPSARASRHAVRSSHSCAINRAEESVMARVVQFRRTGGPEVLELAEVEPPAHDEDMRAFLHEPDRRGETDSAASAGDNCNFPLSFDDIVFLTFRCLFGTSWRGRVGAVGRDALEVRPGRVGNEGAG